MPTTPSDLPAATSSLAKLLREALSLLDRHEDRKPDPLPQAVPPVPCASAGRRHAIDRRAADLAAMPGDDDDLLNNKETSRWLGVSEQWLEIGRSRGYGPGYVRLSPRRVQYRRGTVRQYLIERAHQSTSEYDTRRRDGSPAGRKPGSKLVDGRVLAPEEMAP
jgi:hypothetical protein